MPSKLRGAQRFQGDLCFIDDRLLNARLFGLRMLRFIVRSLHCFSVFPETKLQGLQLK